MRPTYLTIDTSLVRENLRKIKDSLPEWSTSTAVIKANGYGHGSVMMGRIAVEEKALFRLRLREFTENVNP